MLSEASKNFVYVALKAKARFQLRLMNRLFNIAAYIIILQT